MFVLSLTRIGKGEVYTLVIVTVIVWWDRGFVLKYPEAWESGLGKNGVISIVLCLEGRPFSGGWKRQPSGAPSGEHNQCTLRYIPSSTPDKRSSVLSTIIVSLSDSYKHVRSNYTYRHVDAAKATYSHFEVPFISTVKLFDGNILKTQREMAL